MKPSNKAALTGLVAGVLWSAIVGLIRSVSDRLGTTGGAMIYSVASGFLLLSVGSVRLRDFPRRCVTRGSGSGGAILCWLATRASRRVAQPAHRA